MMYVKLIRMFPNGSASLGTGQCGCWSHIS